MPEDESHSTANATAHDLRALIIDTGNWGKNIAKASANEPRYTSNKKLLLERVESTPFQRMRRRRTELDVWIGWIGTLIDLDDGDHLKILLAKTGGRPLLTRAGSTKR